MRGAVCHLCIASVFTRVWLSLTLVRCISVYWGLTWVTCLGHVCSQSGVQDSYLGLGSNHTQQEPLTVDMCLNFSKIVILHHRFRIRVCLFDD